MKRKIIMVFSLLLLLSSLWQFSAVAKAPPGNQQEAILLANEELGFEYFTQTNLAGKQISWIKIGGLSGISIGNTDDTYGALVYGDSHGDTNDGQGRYLGYTYNGEEYTNPAFPHDAWAGGYLEDRNWISEPWRNIQGTAYNEFDGKNKYLPNIQKGLAIYYADVSRGGESDYWNSWHEYTHVLVPPTEYTWGMGRMWHQADDNSIWYISVPLAPGAMLAPNPELVVAPASVTIEVGQSYQFCDCFYPEGQAAGNRLDVTNSSTWSSSDNNIASLASTPGLFSGNSPGQITVTATYTANGKTLQGQAQLIVQEEELPVPPTGDSSPGSLTFQAVSQDGSTNRDPGTAMWTDVVTATLVPPVMQSIAYSENMVEPDYSTTIAPPLPPSGGCAPAYTRITGWHIISADLSYPKQNPEFTFGHPLPPIGEETIPMDVSGGQKATAAFREQWAMDGAYIYDWFTDQLINQEPTNYDITASNIRVQVDYNIVTFHEVCSDDGDCVCVSQTKRGSYMQQLSPITGKLKVDDTGVNSIAG